MTAASAAEQIQLIDLGQLEVHPSNPRKNVGDLDELAASIKSAGLFEPVIAVARDGKYQVVAGSRRLAAAKKAKVGAIPVRVMDLDEAAARAAALIENLQRKDLEPLEQAEAFRGWLALTGRTQKELAETVGLAPSTIANALRLLEAPKPVQDALRTQTIGAEHARVLLTLRDPGLATKLKIKPGITVEDLREDVARINAEYSTKGQGAVDAAKKALADTQAKYPNAVITWRAPQPSSYAAHNLVDLTKAIGKPPAPISGQIRGGNVPSGSWESVNQPTAAKHDAVCECRAYGLSVRENYNRPEAALVFELERVCTSTAGWKKARPKVKRPRYGSSASKEPTPAQLAKQQKAARDRAMGQIKRELTVRKPPEPRAVPLFRKLLRGSMTADVARALVAHETFLNLFGSDDDRVLAWDRIAKMPATKISDLAVSIVAHLLYDEAFRARRLEAESPEAATAKYFGLKVDEAKPARDPKR